MDAFFFTVVSVLTIKNEKVVSLHVVNKLDKGKRNDKLLGF